MNEEEVRDLKERARITQEDVVDSHEEMIRMRNLYKSAENLFIQRKTKFDNIDRQLAMVDGRFRVVKSATPGRISKKDLPINLSGDQIIRIAEVLGIEVEIE